ncbi:MAG: Gp15 family bacteriophage protein [Faecalibacterium prausnitzii]
MSAWATASRAQARVSMRGLDKILGAGASARLGLNENDVSRLYDVLDEITQAAAAEKARYSRPAAVPQNRAQRRAEKRQKDKHKPPVSYPAQPAAAQMVERVDKAARRRQLLTELAALGKWLTSCWDKLPLTWAGRPIDWDFRPMVWFNGQYLRLPEDEKGLPELARETMRRFYRVAVPPEEEVDAFKALVEFYTAGPQEVADRPGSSRTEELALDYVTDGPAIVAAFQQAYCIDLTRARLHWWRFKALMSNLPEETQLVKIVGFRTADLTPVSGRRAGAACRAERTLRSARRPAERRRSHCHPARPATKPLRPRFRR